MKHIVTKVITSNIPVEIKNELFEVGRKNDLGKFTRLITLYRIRDKAVHEANEIFRQGKEYKEPVDVTSKEALKAIMSRAWEISRMAQGMWGGKVKDFFTESLKIAWAEVKYA